MVTPMRARYDYGAGTEGARRPVSSAPYIAHVARGAPLEMARPLRTIRSHGRSPLMVGFFSE
jgi:hypothetical protein